MEDIRDRMVDALKGRSADYLEIRVEDVELTGLQYRGKELESVGRSTDLGGNVRAAVRGGWGFVSFNSMDDLPSKVDLAIRQASLAGSERTQIAPVQPVEDIVPASWSRILGPYLWRRRRHCWTSTTT